MALDEYDPETGEPTGGEGSADLSLTESDDAVGYVLRASKVTVRVRGSLIDIEGAMATTIGILRSRTLCHHDDPNQGVIGAVERTEARRQGGPPTTSRPGRSAPGGRKGGDLDERRPGARARPATRAWSSRTSTEGRHDPRRPHRLVHGHRHGRVDHRGHGRQRLRHRDGGVAGAANEAATVACVDDTPIQPIGRTLQGRGHLPDRSPARRTGSRSAASTRASSARTRTCPTATSGWPSASAVPRITHAVATRERNSGPIGRCARRRMTLRRASRATTIRWGTTAAPVVCGRPRGSADDHRHGGARRRARRGAPRRPRGRRPAQAVRRHRGRPGRLVLDPRRRDLRPARPERRRQDHDDLDGLRAAGPRRRRGHARRPADRRRRGGGEGGHRVRAPGARASTRTCPRARTSRSSGGCTGSAARELKGADRRGARAHRPRPSGRTTARDHFSGGMQRRLNIGDRAAPPAAPAAARRADGRRRPAEPQRDPRVHRGPGRGRAWRSCTRPTTWRRPSACATGSGSSTAARSGPRARARELVALHRRAGPGPAHAAGRRRWPRRAAAGSGRRGVASAAAKGDELEILAGRRRPGAAPAARGGRGGRRAASAAWSWSGPTSRRCSST